ncbi:helix-turn-helix domain-containing protein [Aureibaculum luteum]|uniref:helix-turn-helix domain-containing protein n=1 Tax=Aureibaculum luteum TaxID=1548456 RepID=UPI000E47E97E|nr:helix-turn-helix domain-containing protein [Aureibaculum luteum]
MSEELSMDQVFIKKLNDILEVNIENEHFGVKELAEAIGLSRSQLHRKIQKIKGKSSSRFIREYRLHKAMEMLQNDVTTASEIAYRVGFSSPTYFNTSFRKCFGYPPGEAKHRAVEAMDKVGISSAPQDIILAKKNMSQKKIILSTLLGFILIVTISYFLYSRSNDKKTTDATAIIVKDKSILVLPFKNLSYNKENQNFADGLAESIQNHLNKIKELKIISETILETEKTTSKIVKELDITYLLEGSVQQNGDELRINAKLIDVKKDYQIWSETYDYNLKSIFLIQSEIANLIAAELKMVISPSEIGPMEKMPTKNIEAYNLYKKGIHFSNFKTHSHGEGDKSIRYFKQAIEKDPEFALAYAALANAYIFSHKNLYVIDSVKFVEKLALKSIALDNDLAEGHAALGTLACFYGWDWGKAEKEFKLAILLDPNNATTHIYYSQFLFSVKDHFDEARKQIEIAIDLDPLSYMAITKSAYYYLYSGNYNEALIETAKLKEINKYNMYSYWLNLHIYKAQGKDDIAIAELADYYTLSSESSKNIDLDSLKMTFRKNGIRGIHKYYNENNIRIFSTPSNLDDFILYSDAGGYAHMGNNKKALEYLEIAYKRRCNKLYEIKYDPKFVNLRSDPKFLALLDKMRLGGYK